MKCLLARFRLGHLLDNDQPLPDALERHLEHCPKCLAWSQSQKTLAGGLRREAPAAAAADVAEVPPFLHAKILRAVANDQRESAPGRNRWSRAWLWQAGLGAGGVAAAAAVVTVMALLTLQKPAQLPQGPTMVAGGQAKSGTETGAALKTETGVEANAVAMPDEATLHQPIASKLRAATRLPDGRQLLDAAVDWDQPLRRELALLNEDALAAVRSLRDGFVPGELFSNPH